MRLLGGFFAGLIFLRGRSCIKKVDLGVGYVRTFVYFWCLTFKFMVMASDSVYKGSSVGRGSSTMVDGCSASVPIDSLTISVPKIDEFISFHSTSEKFSYELDAYRANLETFLVLLQKLSDDFVDVPVFVVPDQAILQRINGGVNALSGYNQIFRNLLKVFEDRVFRSDK